MDLCHLRRGGLLARGGPVVAHRRADRDHSHGLAPHILEVAASACALDARPAGPPRVDRRPDWPSARAAAARPRRGAMDLAGSASALRLLEPAAVWPQGDGPGGLALRAEPQPDRPRRTGNNGAAAPGLHDRHALPVLELPGYRPAALVLGLRGDGRIGLLLQVHHGAVPPNSGGDLVAGRLAARRPRKPLPRHAPGYSGNGRLRAGATPGGLRDHRVRRAPPEPING